MKTLTFIAVGTTKKIRNDIQRMLRGMLSGKTNNADPVEHRKDVGRDNLVGEHNGEGDPEELYSLLVALGVEVECCAFMKSF